MRLPLRPPSTHRRSRGQSLVEFALILPVLIILLLITLDFGRLFMSYVTLTNTTRLAANFGATNPGVFTGSGTSPAYDAMIDRETAGLNCELQADGYGNDPPTPTFPNGSGLNATSVATMTCDFTLLTPLISQFFGGPLPLTAQSEFPIRTGAIANVGGSTTLPPPGSPVAAFEFVSVSGGTVDGSGNVTGVGSVTVNINNTSQNAQTYEWTWYDGSTAEYVPQPIAHTYASPGTYTVSLVVTNTSGSSTRTRTVTVTPMPTSSPIPVAGFYGTPTSATYFTGGGSTGTPIQGTRSLAVNFTNTTTDGTDYAWDFGDNGTSTTASPQHTYSGLGIFDVTLTVTLPTGGSPVTRQDYVTVGCQVPNFANRSTSEAAGLWSGADFTGTLRYKAVNAGGNGSTNPPSPARNIVAQSIAGGTFYAPTKNGNNPWRCNNNIIVEYTP
jgi:PKD repeat protein